MILVVDTCVFVWKARLLQSRSGRELLRLMRATNCSLYVPEILRLEYIEKFVEMEESLRLSEGPARGKRAGSLINNAMLGNVSSKVQAESRLAALEPVTISGPSNDELNSAVGARIIAKRRPTTEKYHSYKDCMIWESVLRLPSGSQVRLISNDGAFFERDAVHPELIEEARKRGITVVGYKMIEDVVAELKRANPTLDLAELEAQDFADPTTQPAEAVARSAPIPRANGDAEYDRSVREAFGKVGLRLSQARRHFEKLDLKVLAYIAYFDPARKTDVFSAMAHADIAPDVAKNVVERLTMNGFLHDTGNHYLVTESVNGDLIAPSVEPAIIAWLQSSRGRNG